MKRKKGTILAFRAMTQSDGREYRNAVVQVYEAHWKDMMNEVKGDLGKSYQQDTLNRANQVKAETGDTWVVSTGFSDDGVSFKWQDDARCRDNWYAPEFQAKATEKNVSLLRKVMAIADKIGGGGLDNLGPQGLVKALLGAGAVELRWFDPLYTTDYLAGTRTPQECYPDPVWHGYDPQGSSLAACGVDTRNVASWPAITCPECKVECKEAWEAQQAEMEEQRLAFQARRAARLAELGGEGNG